RVHHHLRQAERAAELPDEACGVECRPAREVGSLAQDDVVPAEARKPVEDRAASHSAADHDCTGRPLHWRTLTRSIIRFLVTRAVIFDFNGTLSHDEPILLAIFQELFAEYGKALSAEQYFDELAGRSDPEIVRTWLGPDHPAIDEVIERRVARYRELTADGSTIPEEVREAVRYTAARVPVAIVSGAARAEIEPVLEAAQLAGPVPGLAARE